MKEIFMLQKGEKIAIWGTGFTAKKAYYLDCTDYQVVCFYDNNETKWGTELYGVPVKKYEKSDNLKIVISSTYWKEIAKQLIKDGLRILEDFIPHYYLCGNIISYRELFDLGYEKIPVMMKKLRWLKKIAIIYGNCQTPIISKILLLSPAFSEEYFFIEIPAVHEYASRMKRQWDILLKDDNFWEQIDLFIYQKVSETNRFCDKLATDNILKKLNDSCRIVNIINIYFSGYFIQATDNKHNLMKDVQQSGLFPFDDKYIDEMVFQGQAKNEILEQITKEDFISSKEIYETVQKSLWELEEREKNVDVIISDYIIENYDKKQLFYSFNHPVNTVLIEYARRILRFLGYEDLEIDESVVYLKAGCLKGTDIPIYPSVLKILKIVILSTVILSQSFWAILKLIVVNIWNTVSTVIKSGKKDNLCDKCLYF